MSGYTSLYTLFWLVYLTRLILQCKMLTKFRVQWTATSLSLSAIWAPWLPRPISCHRLKIWRKNIPRNVATVCNTGGPEFRVREWKTGKGEDGEEEGSEWQRQWGSAARGGGQKESERGGERGSFRYGLLSQFDCKFMHTFGPNCK